MPYLKDVYVTEKETLKSLVVDKPIIVVFDEISDEEVRSVCIITFDIPEMRDNVSSYIAATYFERKAVDHAKVAQLSLRAVTEYNVIPDFIVGFCWDNVQHNFKSYREILNPLWPNSIYLSCFANVMHLVMKNFLKIFTSATTWCKNWPQYFIHSGGA